ncbi:MAG: phosphoglycerate dehydrogenase [Acidobacteria bacterium]|nr:phosphoglycerate dehydrogenase [Acidobacteriota bacterium]
MSSQSREATKILLLENIHMAAVEAFQAGGRPRDVVTFPGALSEDQLIEMLKGVHILGIRSKTNVGERVLAAAPQLAAVGCFCIGTDQVDLEAAAGRGVAVFNAPFSNTRSVAELGIAEVIMLARKAVQRTMEMHRGKWEKSAEGCVEVRRKTLGIVGYGHIGPQIGLLAEAMGMKVIFHDIVKKLALGNARQTADLDELLRDSDFVSMHVPDTPLTKGMMGMKQLAMMRKGSFLLNLSRGTVVDIPALKEALESGHISGAALDVYPQEPASGDDPFEADVRGMENVILTPHIGGSTEEAQRNIGVEVAEALNGYFDEGTSTGCVNLPEVQLPVSENSVRILNIHKDVPGVLGRINSFIAGASVNIKAQNYRTHDGIGYLIMDAEKGLPREVGEYIEALDSNIRTRLLF